MTLPLLRLMLAFVVLGISIVGLVTGSLVCSAIAIAGGVGILLWIALDWARLD